MTTEERFTRMESILERLVDRQDQQDEVLTTLAESQIRISESQKQLTDSQAQLTRTVEQTEIQVQALGHAVDLLSRQWQAYINTLRPQ